MRARWVIDTNVLVSGFISTGSPAKALAAVAESLVQPFTSKPLLDELNATLAKKKLAKYVAATGMTAEALVSHYRDLATVITARKLTRQHCRDADDDAVLACALAARAKLIVTGDKDLLSMKRFRGIAIVTAAQALQTLHTPACHDEH